MVGIHNFRPCFALSKLKGHLLKRPNLKRRLEISILSSDTPCLLGVASSSFTRMQLMQCSLG